MSQACPQAPFCHLSGDVEHQSRFLHPCANGAFCLITTKLDPGHCRRYAHVCPFPLAQCPEHKKGDRSHTKYIHVPNGKPSANHPGFSGVKSALCSWGSQCRRLDDRAHTDEFYHTDRDKFRIREVQAPKEHCAAGDACKLPGCKSVACQGGSSSAEQSRTAQCDAVSRVQPYQWKHPQDLAKCPNGYECRVADEDHVNLCYHSPFPVSHRQACKSKHCDHYSDYLDGRVTTEVIKHLLWSSHPCDAGLGCTARNKSLQTALGKFTHDRLCTHDMKLQRCSNEEKCTLVTDKNHLAHFTHPCPRGSSCNDRTLAHNAEYLHPCPHQFDCVLLDNEEHMASFLHFPRFPPMCLESACTHASVPVHMDMYQHVCRYGRDCTLMAVPSHVHRFQHPCTDDPCKRTADAEHMAHMRHRCAEMAECPIYQFAHAHRLGTSSSSTSAKQPVARVKVQGRPITDAEVLMHLARFSHMHNDSGTQSKLVYPKYWSVGQASEPAYFPVPVGSPEHSMVLDKLHEQNRLQAGRDYTSVTVERYQSTHFWSLYCLLRSAIAQKHNGNPNEMLLWHGCKAAPIIMGSAPAAAVAPAPTPAATAAATAAAAALPAAGAAGTAPTGFDNTMADPNSQSGIGTYFSPSSAYSFHDRYVGTGPVRVLLLCLVAVGSSARGKVGMRRPPQDDARNQVHDSMFGYRDATVPNPWICEYVTCDKWQAYPMYKLTIIK